MPLEVGEVRRQRPRSQVAVAGQAAAREALEKSAPARWKTVRARLLYTRVMTEVADSFDSAFAKAVDLGNRLADKDKDADLWDIADGLLAGALQYWLYSRQPCGDPRCQDCMPISTAEGRMAELKRLVDQLAAESEYFHTPTDANAGRA